MNVFYTDGWIKNKKKNEKWGDPFVWEICNELSFFQI